MLTNGEWLTNLSAGVATVTLDRDVTYCTPTAGSYFGENAYANVVGFTSNTVTVYTWYLDSTTHLPVASNKLRVPDHHLLKSSRSDVWELATLVRDVDGEVDVARVERRRKPSENGRGTRLRSRAIGQHAVCGSRFETHCATRAYGNAIGFSIASCDMQCSAREQSVVW